MSTQTYTGTLTVVECCSCHMDFGMTDEFYAARRSDHGSFSCPAGHRQHFNAKSEAERLRERLVKEEGRATRLLAQVDQERSGRQAADRRVTAMKGVVTKTKKRIAKGKCTRCTHEFPDLAAHMAEVHPDYAPEAEA